MKLQSITKYGTIFALALALSIGIVTQAHNPLNQHSQVNKGSRVQANSKYKSNVEMFVNGKKISENHNVLMQGQNIIRSQITGGQTLNWNDIALGNGTAPTNTSTTLDKQYSSCGLSPKTGTVNNMGNGKWNLTATFTVSGCNGVIVNTTAELSPGASSNLKYFAGTALPNQRKLYNGDNLKIAWINHDKTP